MSLCMQQNGIKSLIMLKILWIYIMVSWDSKTLIHTNCLLGYKNGTWHGTLSYFYIMAACT